MSDFSEPDFREIERRHDEPPDEPHPRHEEGEAEECPKCGDDFPRFLYNLHLEVVAFECRKCGHKWEAPDDVT